jgi:UDP-N-acetylglucosamine--N-acetylmuramyl-(pentapeptide) pyrophosphoryl-undecaprenol N-acetylglucosamine transferase
LGGYASIPLGLAAARTGVPLVLLEQNLIPGQANRLLARWASCVCSTFADSADYFAERTAVHNTGNPVRRSIVAKSAERAATSNQWRDADPILLVLGGSQGAQSINRFVVEVLPTIAPLLRDWEVIHQTGACDADAIRAAYDVCGIRCAVTPFIDDIAEAYSRATLAIARAGATTLAELAVSGIPAVLVPYPFAAANHQWHNAQSMGRCGAAMVVQDRPEPGRTAAALVSAITPLLRIPELRREMRFAMLKLAEPDAAAAVASVILSKCLRNNLTRQSA